MAEIIAIDDPIHAAVPAPMAYAPRVFLNIRERLVLPAGSLRIGGDSPDGLVLSGGAPAARTVRLLDMATGELIAQTVSSGAGVYSFTGLSDRSAGYAAWIVGATGERDIIIPGLHPGSP